MNNKISVLLKSLLLSTSSINKIKYGNKQKRKKAITDLAGISIIYISLLAYCISTCIGYGKLGLTSVIPIINIITISTCSFIFTFFKGGSYLFLFKDYDMLMSLPFSVKQIVAGKFLCMYINSLPFMMCISISMLIGYCIFAPFNLITIIWWIILSIISPIIPTVIAALISSLILIVSSRFKYKKFIQTILSYLLVLFCFSLEFIIGGAAPNGEFDELLKNLASQLDNTKKIYIPALWFENAVVNGKFLDGLVLCVISALALVIFAYIININFKKVNTRLSSYEHHGELDGKSEKKRSAIGAIVFKEFKRMTSSSLYMSNVLMGHFLSLILGIGLVCGGKEKIISSIVKGGVIDNSMIIPVIPFAFYFMISMVSTTAITPSLEGKNYWIIKSLPIDRDSFLKGKVYFNMLISIPFGLITSILAGIAFGASVLQIISYMFCMISMLYFSSTFGAFIGFKFINLEWENEIEIIKQGKAVVIYMFPNIVITAFIAVIVELISKYVNTSLLIILAAAFFWLISKIFYKLSMRSMF